MRTTKNQPGHSKTAGGTNTAETPLIAELRKLGVDPQFFAEIIEVCAWGHMDDLRARKALSRYEIQFSMKCISACYLVFDEIMKPKNM